MRNQRNTIFISCGQYLAEERKLGQDIAKLVKEITTFEPYFAQNETTFEGFTQNIFGALNRCAGFIGVMHHRGRVTTTKREFIRASVWIEQEIAIASFLQNIFGREIRVAVFIQNGIEREGVRDKIVLNAIDFKSNGEVIEHLRTILPDWKPVSPDQPTGPELEAKLDYKDITRDYANKGKHHDYQLILNLKNMGDEKITDFRVDWEFPAAFLNPTGNPYERKDLRTATHRFFSKTRKDWKGKPEGPLYKGDPLALELIEYFVEDRNWNSFLDQKVKVTIKAENMDPVILEKPMSELNRF